MGGFKDKDLMADGCGLTKRRQYGDHLRPPRMQERNNQRQRYLNKDEKRDMNQQELDFKLDDNGQVYVDEEPSNNQVLTFGDIVTMPAEVKNINQYHDFNTDLQKSVNDIGGGFDVQVNQKKNQTPVEFDFTDTNVKQPQQADVSNDDIIFSDEQEDGKKEEDPFADLFNDNETTQNDNDENNEQNTDETQKTNENDKDQNKQNVDQQISQEQNIEQEQNTEDANDGIDEYLTMEIDDSKLSEQNKQKLDSFTEQQMDAFKKFLYEKRNG